MSWNSTDIGPHDHVFLGEDHARNERRTWLVIALTATMTVAEITAGTVFGSMALLADGWHMSTHASALLITALAYRYARRHARNPRFTFGTGKLGDLAAFGSATVLAIVALLIGWESLVRLLSPVPISFDEAILVAAVGLAVNVVSALLLKNDHHHHHGHGKDRGHHHHHDHEDAHGADHAHHGGAADHAGSQDNNLRAAYFHVLADALTSVPWSSSVGRLFFCAIAGRCCLTTPQDMRIYRLNFVLQSKANTTRSLTFISGNSVRATMVPLSRL